MACMDYMDPDVRCPQKAIKLNHSLTHCLKFSEPMLIYYQPHSDGE